MTKASAVARQAVHRLLEEADGLLAEACLGEADPDGRGALALSHVRAAQEALTDAAVADILERLQ